MENNNDDLQSMVIGYTDAAEWAETNTERYEDGKKRDCKPIDSYNAAWTSKAYEICIEDCKKFIKLILESNHPEDLQLLDAEQMGHDFWLTRRGHGTGFWDRDLGAAGDRLTVIANEFDESLAPFVTDNNTIDFM